jgi:hypothetical protein
MQRLQVPLTRRDQLGEQASSVESGANLRNHVPEQVFAYGCCAHIRLVDLGLQLLTPKNVEARMERQLQQHCVPTVDVECDP